jgi:hypothetical protein
MTRATGLRWSMSGLLSLRAFGHADLDEVNLGEIDAGIGLPRPLQGLCRSQHLLSLVRVRLAAHLRDHWGHWRSMVGVH